MRVFDKLYDISARIMYILSKPQKRLGMIVFILTFIGAIFETLGVSIIVPFVQVLLNQDKFLKNNYVKRIIELFNIDPSKITGYIVFLVILLYISKNLYLIFLAWVRSKYSCKIQRELSVLMLDSYMKRDYEFFLDHNTGDLIRGVTTDIVGVYGVIYHALKIMTEVLTIACICLYICISDTGLAITMILLCVMCLLLAVLVFRRKMGELGKLNWQYNADLNQHVLHVFEGIKEVIVSQREEYFLDSYEKTYIKKQRCEVGQVVGAESPAYIIEGLCVAGVLLAIFFRIDNSGNMGDFIATLAALAVAAFRILPSLGRITNGFNMLTYHMPSLMAVYNNISEVRNNKEEKNDIKYIENKFVFTKEIELKDISWKYTRSQEKILDGLNLKIKKGQSIAFIGQSGAGKTTLADILLGILKPQIGSVKIDNQDINELQGSWRKLIGYVPQNIYLTEQSIKNNIAFGIKEDEISEEKIEKALKQAQLFDTVQKLPEGVYTMIGEKGIKLSGGQRQRIAIARALYEDPEVVIFDEATAALDNETERAVMDSIEALQGKKTLIIIAHRLTTIQKCDVIYEIVNKNIVERKYEDLVK